MRKFKSPSVLVALFLLIAASAGIGIAEARSPSQQIGPNLVISTECSATVTFQNLSDGFAGFKVTANKPITQVQFMQPYNLIIMSTSTVAEVDGLDFIRAGSTNVEIAKLTFAEACADDIQVVADDDQGDPISN